MNSLNIVSRLTTTPPPSPPRSRTSSSAHLASDTNDGDKGEAGSSARGLDVRALSGKLGVSSNPGEANEEDNGIDEKTPLLDGGKQESQSPNGKSRIWQIPKRVAHAILYGATVIYSTITAPGRYVIACFYDDAGHFSAILPLKRFRSLLSRQKRKSSAQAANPTNVAEPLVTEEKQERPRPQHRTSKQRSPSVDSNASAMSSDDNTENEKAEDSPARHTRSKTGSAGERGDDLAPHRKSGRIKLLPNEEALRKRRIARAQQKKAGVSSDDVAAVASTLKSPSSPTASSKLTRYPRQPAPPRPLVPRRQPSYTFSAGPTAPKKTLIIDLDETLIHSMAKGGRMSTGHMVEVRLGGGISSGGVQLGPGVPILYYVHERPGCHEFLRKVAKWYSLIVFTASVQEYADPVIDWLERERKYFSGRYYRQHCTFRNGAYIKDLAQVEPDLSKVMILDNSPMSYIFHEDNAIPIEGWISDPTDNDLIHLIPLLEGLQYVTDVRALLALRQGQAQQA
ncbi:Nuclear envelope morphology protein 1 [Recurvomyces mirabilis]|nr:Nuclear envelope morphology protein 1 [Recurvomyces mirabilis]